MLSRTKLRKFAVAGATFSVALGIGFVMQNGDALASRFSDLPARAAPQPQVVPVQAAIAPAMPIPQTADIALPVDAAAALPDSAPGPVQIAAAVTRPGDALPAMPVEAAVPDTMLAALETELPFLAPAPPPVAIAPDCTVTLTATVLPAAMVRLDLAAPCAPDQMATIHHQGMMFSALTDRTGQLGLTVPALVVDAVFIADLGDSQGAVAVAAVPEIAGIDRAVLQWQGLDGLGIHAREFGADYGTTGHVWSGNPHAAAAMPGQGGYMIRLGDPTLAGAMLAEVYTYPSDRSERAGRIVLSVEAEITAANCGQEIAAQAIQVSPGGPPFATDLTMTLPGCEAVGEYILLSNMLLDLTLAAR